MPPSMRSETKASRSMVRMQRWLLPDSSTCSTGLSEEDEAELTEADQGHLDVDTEGAQAGLEVLGDGPCMRCSERIWSGLSLSGRAKSGPMTRCGSIAEDLFDGVEKCAESSERMSSMPVALLHQEVGQHDLLDVGRVGVLLAEDLAQVVIEFVGEGALELGVDVLARQLGEIEAVQTLFQGFVQDVGDLGTADVGHVVLVHPISTMTLT